ncbi:DUF2243 domain-containing protein [Rubellimicrobium arenae]|uniref:DUF2243 domain-containing protein n=1 Tax=Rubellimicrobium arenae TaxID=2817372 RepID=UPI001B30758F|nr:DUF2243 domain-containing protein [Rubellimicrobium arenae]
MDDGRRWSPQLRSGAALGFALGGFFDGILLHQILQWHHLLSLVPGVGDLRRQVLWDGAFHALMYLIAALALWRLWSGSRRAGLPGPAALAGSLLMGFGAWHAVDAVLSHWILGIHRIRVDTAAPLAWDLGWLAVFGLVPLGLGWMLLGRDGSGPRRRAGPAVLGLALLTAGLGAWALRPSGTPYTVAVFGAGQSAAQIEAGLTELGAQVVWAGPSLDVVVIDMPPERRWSLYRQGAWFVSGTGVPAGCLGWSRPGGTDA